MQSLFPTIFLFKKIVCFLKDSKVCNFHILLSNKLFSPFYRETTTEPVLRIRIQGAKYQLKTEKKLLLKNQKILKKFSRFGSGFVLFHCGSRIRIRIKIKWILSSELNIVNFSIFVNFDKTKCSTQLLEITWTVPLKSQKESEEKDEKTRMEIY